MEYTTNKFDKPSSKLLHSAFEEKKMLSGVKFIPRDQINIDSGSSQKVKKKSGGSRKSKSKYDSSSDDGAEKMKKSSRSKKRKFSSEESSSSYSSESEMDPEHEEKKRHKKRRPRKSKKYHSSDKDSSGSSESEDEGGKRERGSKRGGHKIRDDDSGGSLLENDKERSRREAGLDWMLKPATDPARMPAKTDDPPEEPEVEEVKANPKELNPFLNDNGSGYPEDVDQKKAGGNQLAASSVVGDGGASWRLKAIKRAREQAAREGRRFEEVVEERHGSVDQLAVPAAFRAAPAHAHLHAIQNRRKGITENSVPLSDDRNNRNIRKVHGGRSEYLKDVSSRHPEMRAPKVHDSLSWRKKEQHMSKGETQPISAEASSLNKFVNDGGFMRGLTHQQKDSIASSRTKRNATEHMKSEIIPSDGNELSEESPILKQALTANQLAAKAMQLRLKGKHEEAEKLLKEAQSIKMNQESGSNLPTRESEGMVSRYAVKDSSVKQKKKEDDADRHLAQKIAQNKQYSISGQSDDEYDFDDGPTRKRSRKRQVPEQDRSSNVNQILTQQERCQFCFENPRRPRHLVVAIANFTYLMLPQSQPLVQGHCCILPMQHESSTRNVDDNVWVELRNFKKCLIEMFGKQNKDVVFLETVMGLAKQRRHCLVECIPLPREIAREAPLYFKKAIDEAEDEWSQHNAKKLISTSREKGLRNSVPKNFPYFYVEFGLDEGFVHVIDDEQQFKSSLGLNVLRGMLQLPEEDMYRRRRHESVETQQKAVESFAREWGPFDWTKDLE